ncbi:MAG: hypothetical protein IT379_19240, partial [Deltaproteobacteria bacterium]|nr:hypothetical protein [Deltaproteobacteria bacterium]
MRSTTLATVLVALVGASACSDSETEATVDVVVTAPPPGIDPMLARLRVSAEWLGGASTRSFERAATFDGDGLVTTVFRIRPERDAHTGTELYRFRAEGIADGRAIVSAQARLVFLAGRRLVLPLRLTQSCVDVECDEDSTCFDGSCVDDFVPACSLEGARGSDCTDAGPSRDASTMDVASRDGDAPDAVSPDAPPPLDAASPLDTAPPMDVAPPTDVADLGIEADVDASGACSPATCVALGGCDTARCEGDACVHTSLCRDDERCCGNVCAFDCAALGCLGMPAGTPCRAAAGPCDVVERCDGVSPSCPPDGHASSDVPCRETPNACDETETCTGDGPACPMDLFAPAGAPCADGVCDGLGGCAPCTEGAACATGRACERGRVSCAAGRFECVSAGPVTAGTSCREAVGDCDVAESCDGVGLDCPTNRFEPSSTVCRAGGGCDRTERCTGTSADCPPDALEPATTVCRALVPGGCDVADRCTGTSPVCPPDVVRPNGTSCRTSTGVCDAPESCDGVLPTC